MFGTVSAEREAKVSANEAWKLYGSLKLAEMVAVALPHLFSKIEVVQGDGSAGTILQLFNPPGDEGVVTWFKEEFKVVDDEKRVKITEVVEGGYLDLGFTLFRFNIEVIEKQQNKNECVIRSAIEYELKEEAAANAALVSIQPLIHIMELANAHLHQTYNTHLTN